MKSLKARLKANELTIGSWIQFAHSGIAEIMAKAGFDWLVVDMEHSAIELQQAQQLIQIIELAGCTPLVRVGENNPYLIKRVMDAGAHGVIVPMVNTKEDAIRAVKAVKYPPLGERGVGLARAQGYGANFKKYFDTINSESIVIVQVEHKEGVKNIRDIIEVDEVDGVMIGPYDISASYGVPGELKHHCIKEAEEIVKKAVKAKGIVLGTHVVWPPAENIVKKIEEGFNFIAYSSDMIMLQYYFKDASEKIRRILE